jgi:hypothetical protein
MLPQRREALVPLAGDVVEPGDCGFEGPGAKGDDGLPAPGSIVTTSANSRTFRCLVTAWRLVGKWPASGAGSFQERMRSQHRMNSWSKPSASKAPGNSTASMGDILALIPAQVLS